jgi:hypothetical protein
MAKSAVVSDELASKFATAIIGTHHDEEKSLKSFR